MITDAARQALMNWYQENHRDLPWRRTRDPYRIMVSEIMLQQTQVDRVIPKYQAFLEAFPTLHALADAPVSAVIRAWAGLGYNRRAVNLQRACRAVVNEFGGEMPRDVAQLRLLPGIGAYTAGAIACFAFEQDVGFADTNIRRVLHRVTTGSELPEWRLKPRELEQIAADLVPEGDGYFWNQALMELGATVCRSRSAACGTCPLANWCEARPVIKGILAAQPSRKPGNAHPFETTNRYFRGRIVDLLRDTPAGLARDDLARYIKPEAIEFSWIDQHLDALIRDGLVVATDGQLRERQPSYDGEPLARATRYRLPD